MMSQEEQRLLPMAVEMALDADLTKVFPSFFLLID